MNTKGKMLLWVLWLVLIFCVSPILPKTQMTVLAADASQTTITVKNKEFYNYLVKTCFQPNLINNQGALVSYDDQAQTITLNMDKVKWIEAYGVDMTKDNSKDVLITLITGCTNLQALQLSGCNLTGVDLSVLESREKLTNLTLANAQLKEIPDIELKNVKFLNLSKNNFSANGACSNFTGTNFPKVQSLYLDQCQIADIGFLDKYGGGVRNLTTLSLGNDKLTDDSIEALLGMSGGSLSKLKKLYLGIMVHDGNGVSYNVHMNSSNMITNPARLALIPGQFKNLEELDLTALQITSLKAFADAGVRTGVKIDLRFNEIQEFAGLEGNSQITMGSQRVSISGNFTPEWECEMPELIKNILDQSHPLKGTLENYVNCRLSDDGTKIIFESGVKKASVEITSGKLKGSKITLEPIRKVPSYTVPQGLTATEGDTLAKVILPEGFAWKDASQSVGAAGTRSFRAVYTPQDTKNYISVEIDVPVTVKTPPKKPTPPATELESEETKPDESNLTGNQIEARKDLSLLLATGKQKGKNSIELTWKKKNGCSGYEVYWSYCDGKKNFKKVKTVKSSGKRSYVHKNLKKNRAYKYYIATYKIKNGKKLYQSKSPTIHVAMKEEKRTNVKSISVNKTKVSLKAKKTFQIKATAKAENKKKKVLTHTLKFRYYTNDKSVATVTEKGKIKAKKKGSCSIFVIANNGVSKEIKVTVK